MPITVTPNTTDANESRAAKLLRLKRIVAGEIKTGELPAGDYHAVVKTASIYHNPKTDKRSYRAEVEVTVGDYKGSSTLIFTSADNEARLVEMAQALGLTSDDHLGMLLDEDPAFLHAMQGRAVRLARVVKDPMKPTELTNNWLTGRAF